MSVQAKYSDQHMVEQFLTDHGWSDAEFQTMGADMGLRRYAKLLRGKDTALLMDTSRCGERESLNNFIKIADYLRDFGVNTPKIYHYDLGTSLSIIEQLGEESLGFKKNNNHDPNEIYQIAIHALVTIKNEAKSNDLNLTNYNDTHLRECLDQFVDYYVPVASSHEAGRNIQDEFQSTLKEIEENLPPCPMGFCHADYHLENLMWCSDKEGGYGLIDFQDAFWGFCGYDLINLLEDARQTVPNDIKTEMKNIYCSDMTEKEREIFEAWYTYLSMHFHCRVIGLFIKFAKENGGTEFLAHIPRLQGYIKQNLKDPLMKPLNEFMIKNQISFDCDVA